MFAKNKPYIEPPYAVVPPKPADDEPYWEIHDGYGRTATVWGDPKDPETKATAEFIVRACNNHDELVQMLARIDGAHDYMEIVNATEGAECLTQLMSEARALLAKVRS